MGVYFSKENYLQLGQNNPARYRVMQKKLRMS